MEVSQIELQKVCGFMEYVEKSLYGLMQNVL
jgi:hypothetical protein